MTSIIDLNFLGVPNSIASFVIPSTEGPILIETGPHSTLKNLEAGLNYLGYDLKDVKHVFVSHIHLDHAGAAWCFANHGAKIYVHPLGAKHLHQPEKLLNSAKQIYKDQMDYLWGTLEPIPASLLVACEHGSSFKIGNRQLTTYYTPGHAVHHNVIQFENVLFTGDVAGVKIGDLMVVPPCPPPDIQIESWLSSIKLIASLEAEAFYMTHFGLQKETTNILETLQENLLKWSTWIKPYFDSAVSPEHIVPEFKQFMEEELKKSGASAEDLDKYDKANPAWMSVYGLLRYWKKRTEN